MAGQPGHEHQVGAGPHQVGDAGVAEEVGRQLEAGVGGQLAHDQVDWPDSTAAGPSGPATAPRGPLVLLGLLFRPGGQPLLQGGSTGAVERHLAVGVPLAQADLQAAAARRHGHIADVEGRQLGEAQRRAQEHRGDGPVPRRRAALDGPEPGPLVGLVQRAGRQLGKVLAGHVGAAGGG